MGQTLQIGPLTLAWSYVILLISWFAGTQLSDYLARRRGLKQDPHGWRIAIIGLLASYVGPKYFSQLGKSEQGVTKAQIEAFARALDAYRLDVGYYPSTEEGLNALLARPGNAGKWNGPYLQKAVPPDPWGRPYLYRAPGSAGDFDIISYGQDGQPGGTGDAADVTNQ